MLVYLTLSQSERKKPFDTFVYHLYTSLRTKKYLGQIELRLASRVLMIGPQDSEESSMSKQDYDSIVHNPPAFFEPMHRRASSKGSSRTSHARLLGLDDLRQLDALEASSFALNPFVGR